MVALKYAFMKENIFRFYRGTCHLFYEDLSKSSKIPPSPLTWISGDLHVENFGSFKGDNRLVHFDLNDFDEAILAPASYELVRAITSIFLAFKSLSSGKPTYIDPRTAKGIVCEFLTAASNRGQKNILRRKTFTKNKKIGILIKDAKHLQISKTLKKQLFAHIKRWLKNDGRSPYNYKPIDAVFRIAGTGSVGLKRYAVLLKSLNKTGEKYMLIDMKQSMKSSLAPFVHTTQPKWQSQSERIVDIQKIMQNRPPALLSTSEFKKEHYVMQEMQPTKDSIDFRLLRKRYRDMYQVIDDMGVLTASSQLRATGRMGSAIADELIAFGRDTSWQQRVLDYSMSYADTVKQYYRNFKKEFKKGVYRS
jgi:uncharacterized protein (DUF2252 family)